MYNGIGLVTPRGSGTNGYVQRNLSTVRPRRSRQDTRTDEELDKLESSLTRAPNPEILEHERKRGLELKCAQLQDMMEEQGYSVEEIDEKGYSVEEIDEKGYSVEEIDEKGYSVEEIDEKGYSVEEIDEKGYSVEEIDEKGYSVEEIDEKGYSVEEIDEKVATFRLMLQEKEEQPIKEGAPSERPTATETHQLAAANQLKNERLRAAFGIRDDYEDGSSFHPERRARERERREQEERGKKEYM
ncbi:Serine/arginine repetitive matrix protein 2 [Acipenser ruthenus]|uniref:Serine/arginine repetitive matrix protein 2 n=1 Tax=Acipenser ruthenus TaxID=7906 RepID=A0A444U4E7_ACIRT|nr:Serine/arginine repetitive matrix protein 2 [Acipenser ruthenus]